MEQWRAGYTYKQFIEDLVERAKANPLLFVLLALEQDIILMGRDILYHFDTLSAHQLHKRKRAFGGGL